MDGDQKLIQKATQRHEAANVEMGYTDADIYGRGWDPIFGNGAQTITATEAKLNLKAIRDAMSGVRIGEYVDYDLYGRADPRIFGHGADFENKKVAAKALYLSQQQKMVHIRTTVFPSASKALLRLSSIPKIQSIPPAGNVMDVHDPTVDENQDRGPCSELEAIFSNEATLHLNQEQTYEAELAILVPRRRPFSVFDSAKLASEASNLAETLGQTKSFSHGSPASETRPGSCPEIGTILPHEMPETSNQKQARGSEPAVPDPKKGLHSDSDMSISVPEAPLSYPKLVSTRSHLHANASYRIKSNSSPEPRTILPNETSQTSNNELAFDAERTIPDPRQGLYNSPDPVTHVSEELALSANAGPTASPSETNSASTKRAPETAPDCLPGDGQSTAARRRAFELPAQSRSLNRQAQASQQREEARSKITLPISRSFENRTEIRQLKGPVSVSKGLVVSSPVELPSRLDTGGLSKPPNQPDAILVEHDGSEESESSILGDQNNNNDQEKRQVSGIRSLLIAERVVEDDEVRIAAIDSSLAVKEESVPADIRLEAQENLQMLAAMSEQNHFPLIYPLLATEKTQAMDKRKNDISNLASPITLDREDDLEVFRGHSDSQAVDRSQGTNTPTQIQSEMLQTRHPASSDNRTSQIESLLSIRADFVARTGEPPTENTRSTDSSEIVASSDQGKHSDIANSNSSEVEELMESSNEGSSSSSASSIQSISSASVEIEASASGGASSSSELIEDSSGTELTSKTE